MSNPIVDEFRDITDGDVEILYNIVSIAQQSHEPPFRALFAAYDDVLAQHGISKDDDRVYFRFLLRMGEDRTGGQTLFEQFELLLAKLGVQLDFSDEEGSNVSQEKFAQEQSLELAEQVHLSPKQVPATHRRASFDSSYYSKPRNNQLALQPGFVSPTKPYSDDALPATQYAPHLLHRAYESPARRLKLQEAPLRHQRHLSGSHEIPKTKSLDALNRISHELSIPINFGVRKPSRLSKDTAKIYVDENANPDHDISRMHQPIIEILRNANPLEAVQVTHDTGLIFRRWREVATEKRRMRLQMRKQAVSLDRRTLLRQGFDQWRTISQKQRQEQETEKFFTQLETRASKARALFLLTKAFTHWAQSAADEVLRTQVAKKHILRTRYFNAWQDITVINELKVRRTMLTKFLRIWRRRTNDILDHSDSAYLLDDSRLVERCYRAWFWKFCERRAPLWYAETLKTRLLTIWARNTQETVDAQCRAKVSRRSELARKAISIWRNRVPINFEHEQSANGFHRQNLMAHAFQRIKLETTFAPLVIRFEQTIDSRVARQMLNIWRNRTALMLHATHVDKLRIMKNSWTNWNEGLRSQALIRTINDRITVEALYKWVLAERALLCERIAIQQLKRKMFVHWARNFDTRYSNLREAKLLFTNIQAQRAINSIFKNWSCHQQELLDQSRRAAQFRIDSLSRRSMQIWKYKHDKCQQLQSWTCHARFYTLTTKSLKLWRDGLESIKRRKRRDGYATVRRKVKTRVVVRLFSKWHTTVVDLRNRYAKANSTYLTSIIRHICSHWRQRTSALITVSNNASMLFQQRLLQQYLLRLVEALNQNQVANARSIEFAAGAIEVAAVNYLRKLNWQLFQIKRYEETALSLEQRNRKKHYRNIIRYWAERTMKRQLEAPTSPSPSANAGSPMIRAQGNSSLAPKWNISKDVNEDNTLESDLGATPGYLRTPSKRIFKSKSRLQTPKTPATTQITPLRVRLLAHTTFDRPLSAKGDFAKRFLEHNRDDRFAETP